MKATTIDEKLDFYRTVFSSREHFESAREDLNDSVSEKPAEESSFSAQKDTELDSGNFFR